MYSCDTSSIMVVGPMNIVKCLGCHIVLESRFLHDFQQCECDNKTFCDGGNVCQRIGGKDLNKVEVIKKPDDQKL